VANTKKRTIKTHHMSSDYVDIIRMEREGAENKKVRGLKLEVRRGGPYSHNLGSRSNSTREGNL
jgi:hypothetical protein